MKKRTEINEIGEFGLIDHLTGDIKLKHKNSALGIGDDAALIDIGKEYLAISTDMLIENIHFDLSYYPLKHVGYKAIVVNVSDIVSMNAITEHIMVNIAFSSRFSVEAATEIYDGIKKACHDYNLDFIGGDTSSSTSGLIISVTAIGRVKKNIVTKRSGANINDIICVTGDLGSAYLGLQILSREKKLFVEDPNVQPKLEGYEYIIRRQMKPKARTDIISVFNKLHIVPTSMIDISDGLASELLHISKQSDVGVTVYEDKIPIATEAQMTAESLNLHPVMCAFNGGEDYELLFTISQKDFDKIRKEKGVAYIGYVNGKNKGNHLINRAGHRIKIEAQGWKHKHN